MHLRLTYPSLDTKVLWSILVGVSIWQIGYFLLVLLSHIKWLLGIIVENLESLSCHLTFWPWLKIPRRFWVSLYRRQINFVLTFLASTFARFKRFFRGVIWPELANENSYGLMLARSKLICLLVSIDNMINFTDSLGFYSWLYLSIFSNSIPTTILTFISYSLFLLQNSTQVSGVPKIYFWVLLKSVNFYHWVFTLCRRGWIKSGLVWGRWRHDENSLLGVYAKTRRHAWRMDSDGLFVLLDHFTVFQHVFVSLLLMFWDSCWVNGGALVIVSLNLAWIWGVSLNHIINRKVFIMPLIDKFL